MIRAADAIDDENINLVAQAIATALGHSERWHQYRTVARMHIAGFAACQLIERQPSRPGRTPTHSQPLRKARIRKPHYKRVLTPKDDDPLYPV